MSRVQSREYVLKVIFSKLFTLDNLEIKEQYENDVLEEFDKLNNPGDLEFSAKILKKYAENFEEINKMISECLKGYTIDKLFRMDLAIVSVAVTEMYFVEETPTKIIINEAVNLAKKYSTEKSYKFVNGFLADLMKKYPPKLIKLDKPIEKENVVADNIIEEEISEVNEEKVETNERSLKNER